MYNLGIAFVVLRDCSPGELPQSKNLVWPHAITDKNKQEALIHH